MNNQPSAPFAAAAPLRIWPVVILLAVVGAAKAVYYLAGELTPAILVFGLLAPMVAALGLILWWVVASRAPTVERWLGPAAVILIAAVSYWLLHPSNQLIGVIFFFVPTGVVAVGLALVALYRARPKTRVWGAILAAVIGFGFWDLTRNDGVWGDFKAPLDWRWTPTSEEQFLADLKQSGPLRTASNDDVAASAAYEKAAWPEFRGPQRDGNVPGVVLESDWQSHPPKEIWRRKVGPGWSSFAVAGRSIFTQEQRGDVEVVACYDADTGAERWTHESLARFWESAGGAGPRATPTLANGRLFTVGATGLVHCLDPANGAVVWQHDLVKDAQREPLTWGFSSSPLVIDNLVIVYAGGAGDKGVFAYDIKTGEPRWSVPASDQSYSSPQRAIVAGADYVLMITSTGLLAIAPRDGTTAWTYECAAEGIGVLQPLVLESSSVLLGGGMGTRRVDVSLAGDAPQFKDSWTSRDMKATFNDFVSHEGSLYGFDGNVFACIDLETGKRRWKKGRYGNGQVLLLPDADQLLVLAETGEVVLLRANSKNLEEFASLKVLADKTWNHPVLVGNRLYVRNGEEAVCLELQLRDAAAVATSHEFP